MTQLFTLLSVALLVAAASAAPNAAQDADPKMQQLKEAITKLVDDSVSRVMRQNDAGHREGAWKNVRLTPLDFHMEDGKLHFKMNGTVEDAIALKSITSKSGVYVGAFLMDHGKHETHGYVDKTDGCSLFVRVERIFGPFHPNLKEVRGDNYTSLPDAEKEKIRVEVQEAAHTKFHLGEGQSRELKMEFSKVECSQAVKDLIAVL